VLRHWEIDKFRRIARAVLEILNWKFISIDRRSGGILVVGRVWSRCYNDERRSLTSWVIDEINNVTAHWRHVTHPQSRAHKHACRKHDSSERQLEFVSSKCHKPTSYAWNKQSFIHSFIHSFSAIEVYLIHSLKQAQITSRSLWIFLDSIFFSLLDSAALDSTIWLDSTLKLYSVSEM